MRGHSPESPGGRGGSRQHRPLPRLEQSICPEAESASVSSQDESPVRDSSCETWFSRITLRAVYGPEPSVLLQIGPGFSFLRLQN